MKVSAISSRSMARNSASLTVLPGMPSRTRLSFLATLAASPNSPIVAVIQSDSDHDERAWRKPCGCSQRRRLVAENAFMSIGLLLRGPFGTRSPPRPEGHGDGRGVVLRLRRPRGQAQPHPLQLVPLRDPAPDHRGGGLVAAGAEVAGPGGQAALRGQAEEFARHRAPPFALASSRSSAGTSIPASAKAKTSVNSPGDLSLAM